MKKVYIYYLPVCDKRPLDANKIKNYFLLNGHEIVNKPSKADLIIFITCAAFNTAVKACFDKIKKFQKYKAELIVSGCLPDIEKEELSKIFKGKTIGTKSLNDFDKIFPNHRIKFENLKDENFHFENIDYETFQGSFNRISKNFNFFSNLYLNFKKYTFKKISSKNTLLYQFIIEEPFYYLRVAWGCTGNCSYCVIKNAVGPLVSKPLEECIREFKEGLEKGHKNFLITADESGSYGIDINSSLIELIDKLTQIPGDYKITVRALKPEWLVRNVDKLEEILKRDKIKQLEIPVQSGSNKILKLMHRYSNIENFKNSILQLKKSFKKLTFHTHLIFGFPSETWEDYEESLKFVIESQIDWGLIFPFSCRKGTIADEIEPKISDKETIKRFKFAKKFFKKHGYFVFYFRRPHFFSFIKKE